MLVIIQWYKYGQINHPLTIRNISKAVKTFKYITIDCNICT